MKSVSAQSATARIRSLLLVALSALAVLLVCLAGSARAQPVLPGIVITGVRGCEDVGALTFNCTWGQYLVIEGSGFSASERYYLQARFNASTGGGPYTFTLDTRVLPPPPQLNASNPNSSAVFLWNKVYNAIDMGVLFTVSVCYRDIWGCSQAAPGFTLAVVAPPVLFSISGCQGSGSQTTMCRPATDVLTFTGSSLQLLNETRNSGLVVWIATRAAGVTSAMLEVVSTTVLTLRLLQMYEWLLLPAYYNSSVVLPIRLGGSLFFETNALNISFVPLPPPTITALIAPGCQQSTGPGNSTAFTQCQPASTLGISTDYAYNVNVSIGGVACAIFNQRAYAVYCQLPLIPDYVPGVMYDLFMGNDQGNVTVPAAFAFGPRLSITRLSPCNVSPLVRSDPLPLRCNANQTLHVSGNPAFPTGSFNISFTAATGSSISCLQPTRVDARTLSCVLPAPPADVAAAFLGQRVAVQVVYNASWNSGPVTATVYDYADAPRVSAVSGCQAVNSSGLLLSGCNSGDVLTVYGSNFLSEEMTAQAWPVPFLCDSVTVTSSSEMSCRLPDNAQRTLESGVVYSITLVSATQTAYEFSNTFAVVFNFSLPPPKQPSSSSSSSSSPPAQTSVSAAALPSSSSTPVTSFTRSSQPSSSARSASSSSASASPEVTTVSAPSPVLVSTVSVIVTLCAVVMLAVGYCVCRCCIRRKLFNREALRRALQSSNAVASDSVDVQEVELDHW